MKKLLFGFSLLLTFSCIPEIIEPEIIDPLPLAVERKCNPKDICCFDLGDQVGEFDLFSNWEFIAFQHKKGSSFDNLTCNARIAVFALGGKNYDAVFRVMLKFEKSSSALNSCVGLPRFELRTFSNEIKGCYAAKKDQTIQLKTPNESITYLQGPANTTLPVLAFEQDILADIQNVESYIIESNKLYLSVKGKSYKLLFVARKD
jgi:hypothetical protein